MSAEGLPAAVLRVGLPILLAFAAGALILLALGKNPLDYYAFVFRRGLLSWAGLQETITRSAPLLLIAAGLIVAFRAGIWNLGVDGQFLLAAVVCAAVAPWLIGFLPRWLTLVSSLIVAALVGASWSLVPALLKARYGVNEIITTLMMSFLGISLANVLIKAAFWDPATTVPQTRTLPVASRLPRLFDTTIHFGIVIAVVAILFVHFVMTRTAFGLKLRIVGANPHAAVHAGLPMAPLTFATFALSAALIGMGGAIEILGVHGTVRADWNPAYGLLVIPLVFLARFNGLGSIVFVLFFAALQIGGESAARRLDVPHYYVLLLVSLVLLFLAIVEYLDQQSSRRRVAA
ncbi:MAG TPA: ABC transporter permease [Alphaproteobacteria bacterium]|nr:ABC transporter permease [Alphaproteobacteria bacterium]